MSTESGYKWDNPGEWLESKIVENINDPRWLADALRSLISGGNIDSDTIQDVFQSEMSDDGYFEKDGDSDDEPSESDGYIADAGSRGYSVSFDEKFVGEYQDRDEAETALKTLIEDSGFSPNCWFVDDHGGNTLISVREDGMYWTEPIKTV